MSRTTIRVFEHERLRLGDRRDSVEGGPWVLGRRELDALERFADGPGHGMVRLVRRGVRFTHFVGYLQVGQLGIEIIPKADRHAEQATTPWRDALLDMLSVVHRLRLKHPTDAHLESAPGSLLEVFVRYFLERVEALQHRGLVRGYRRTRGNRPAFRGRLIVTEHLRHNLVNAQRVFVEHQAYDHDVLVNRALLAALRVLQRAGLRGGLRNRVARVAASFPEDVGHSVDVAALRDLVLDRRTECYADALQLARVILEHHRPSLDAGSMHVLALLFDMNQLWERFVAAVLRRGLPGALVASAQDSTVFWRPTTGRARTIRPDIVVRDPSGDVRVIIDTKWKCPTNGSPGGGDLQQMFVYNERYQCEHSMLLYPGGSGADGVVGTFEGARHRCSTRFVDVLERGTYRRSSLAKRLLEVVGPSSSAGLSSPHLA